MTGTDLRAHLLAHAPLVAIIAARVYPQVLPQSGVLPAVVYTVISDVPTNSLCGTGLELRNLRVQLDCIARDLGAYDAAHALADAVADAMRQPTPLFKALQLNRRDQYDRDAQMHSVVMDFSLWQ